MEYCDKKPVTHCIKSMKNIESPCGAIFFHISINRFSECLTARAPCCKSAHLREQQCPIAGREAVRTGQWEKENAENLMQHMPQSLVHRFK